jgi:hypothetical protein
MFCYPAFPALERLESAYLPASLYRGSDVQAGCEAHAAFMPLTDQRAPTMLDLFARPGVGNQAEAFRVMPALEYDALLDEVFRACRDRAYAACQVCMWIVVTTIGTKP